jgi:rhodanese-related sulfurtransferase
MPKLLKEFIIITLLTGLGTAYSLVTGLSPLPWVEPEIGPGEIRAEDARALDVIWVDARSEEDYRARHVPGAVFYNQGDPAGSMASVLENWLNAPRTIVVYCADEGCGTSRKIADELRLNLPEAEVYSLKGGWEAWAE